MTDRTIYAALDAARQKFGVVVKNRQAHQYKYADLNTVLAAVEPALREEGLGLFQSIEDGHLVTRLVRLDGTDESLFTNLPLPTGLDPQKLGSAITYYRRYEITTLLGLVTEDDDDGSSASSGATGSYGAAATRPEIADGKQGTTGTPAASLPDGWFSQDDCTQAHNDLAAHIKTLSESKQAEARLFREQNGWPVSADLLNALKLALGA